MSGNIGGEYGAAKQALHVSRVVENMHKTDMADRPVNLSPFGLDNGLGREGGAEVFWPTADPSGLIAATVTRKG